MHGITCVRLASFLGLDTAAYASVDIHGAHASFDSRGPLLLVLVNVQSNVVAYTYRRDHVAAPRMGVTMLQHHVWA
jgi:hypothetical protein